MSRLKEQPSSAATRMMQSNSSAIKIIQNDANISKQMDSYRTGPIKVSQTEKRTNVPQATISLANANNAIKQKQVLSHQLKRPSSSKPLSDRSKPLIETSKRPGSSQDQQRPGTAGARPPSPLTSA